MTQHHDFQMSTENTTHASWVLMYQSMSAVHTYHAVHTHRVYKVYLVLKTYLLAYSWEIYFNSYIFQKIWNVHISYVKKMDKKMKYKNLKVCILAFESENLLKEIIATDIEKTI